MKNEILDETVVEKVDNRKPIIRIILISIITILLYFLIEMLRGIVPESLYEKEGVKIQTLGLLIVGIVILISILIPNQLNKVKPVLNMLKVIIWTGITIFVIEVVFKLTQNIVVVNNWLNLDYIQLLKSAGLISGIGMLIANIRIHKLRGKKTIKPVLILIGIWIIVGLTLNYR